MPRQIIDLSPTITGDLAVSKPGPLLSPESVTLPELWKALTAKQALTIPHHAGKMPRVVDWSHHDPELRRNFEIYSAHGLSEAYDPVHPLAFEQSLFTAAARSSIVGFADRASEDCYAISQSSH